MKESLVSPGQEQAAVDRIRVILDGEPDKLRWMLDCILQERRQLANCKIGHGWGFGRITTGHWCFARRTKGGFSATQSAAARPEQTPNDASGTPSNRAEMAGRG